MDGKKNERNNKSEIKYIYRIKFFCDCKQSKVVNNHFVSICIKFDLKALSIHWKKNGKIN